MGGEYPARGVWREGRRGSDAIDRLMPPDKKPRRNKVLDLLVDDEGDAVLEVAAGGRFSTRREPTMPVLAHAAPGASWTR
jgi:hypothetical protein